MVAVNTEAIEGLISAGRVPVVASIAPDLNGVVHNVNADTAAAALAIALGAERLVVLTDVEGLYRDWPNSTEIVGELSASELEQLMPSLESGMVPKMEACLRAVRGGLTRATVTDGRVPHALLLEIFTNTGIGTMVTQDGLVRLGSRVFSADQPIPSHEYANGDFGGARLRSAKAQHDRRYDLSRELFGPAAGQGSAAVLAGYEHAVMNTFGPPKRVFVRGEGCYLWDADGRRYLDLLSGLAVNALGHAHPTVLSAITGQIATLGHVSNFFATPAQVALAARLGAIADPDRGVRTEGLLHQLRDGGQRGGVQDHPDDRPYQDHLHRGSFPRPLVRRVGDHPQPEVPRAVRAAARRGRVRSVRRQRRPGGARSTRRWRPWSWSPSRARTASSSRRPDYLARAREICDQHGALLWIDEVQTGMGRTGCWLVHVAEGVQADIVTVAKGLGNGFPIGACIALGRAATMLGPGSHGSTFGGNPVAAIAGLAAMAVIERDGLLDHATAMGEHLQAGALDLRPRAHHRSARPWAAAGADIVGAGRGHGGRRRP